MLTLLRRSSPYFTTQRFLVPIVLFWALVVSAGMKAVAHCATLTKRVPCADIVSSTTPPHQAADVWLRPFLSIQKEKLRPERLSDYSPRPPGQLVVELEFGPRFLDCPTLFYQATPFLFPLFCPDRTFRSSPTLLHVP